MSDERSLEARPAQRSNIARIIKHAFAGRDEASIGGAILGMGDGDPVAEEIDGPGDDVPLFRERRRFKQTQSLEERLAEEAKRLRAEAKLLPPGAARDELIRRARQAETGSHMSEWLRSPGLRPPD